MANLNKVMLIGRLTMEPECRTFANGGKVAYFRFATNNRKKNMTTGQWEDDPMFIDVKVFNRGEYGKQADLVEEYLHKGRLVFLEGKLVLEQWEDKQTGGKRSKHVVVVDNFQFLEPRSDSGSSGSGYYSSDASTGSDSYNADDYNQPDSDVEEPTTPDNDKIPF